MRVVQRWARFNAVGAAGFMVQTLVVWLLADRAGMHYLGAVALALELAIMHNYVWHARWTWPDRHRKGSGVRRLVQYHALTGATAVANLGCVAVLVEAGGVPYLPASAIAVGACALANFGLADMVVFTRARGRIGASHASCVRRSRGACPCVPASDSESTAGRCNPGHWRCHADEASRGVAGWTAWPWRLMS